MKSGQLVVSSGKSMWIRGGIIQPHKSHALGPTEV